MKKYFPAVFVLIATLACSMPGAPAVRSTQPPSQGSQATQPLVAQPTQKTAPQPTAPQPTAAQPVATPPASSSGTSPTAAPAVSNPNALGSPFSASCGDGIPQIWRNASFNAEMPFDYAAEANDQHGYVTFYPPKGCDVSAAQGEVIAPADGELKQFGQYGYAILLPQKYYPAGLEDVLKYIGIQNPDPAHVSAIQLQFGKYFAGNSAGGQVKKGQSIGEIAVTGSDAPQLEYQVIINYDTGDGVHSYIVSPTLFQYDGKPWPCVQGSPYSCEPKANNYK